MFLFDIGWQRQKGDGGEGIPHFCVWFLRLCIAGPDAKTVWKHCVVSLHLRVNLMNKLLTQNDTQLWLCWRVGDKYLTFVCWLTASLFLSQKFFICSGCWLSVLPPVAVFLSCLCSEEFLLQFRNQFWTKIKLTCFCVSFYCLKCFCRIVYLFRLVLKDLRGFSVVFMSTNSIYCAHSHWTNSSNITLCIFIIIVIWRLCIFFI